jgi:hypothetical protein
MRQLFSYAIENEGAQFKQPVVAVCVKQAAFLQPPAFQAGCHQIECSNRNNSNRREMKWKYVTAILTAKPTNNSNQQQTLGDNKPRKEGRGGHG